MNGAFGIGVTKISGPRCAHPLKAETARRIKEEKAGRLNRRITRAPPPSVTDRIPPPLMPAKWTIKSESARLQFNH
jgi:hypothetical protein